MVQNLTRGALKKWSSLLSDYSELDTVIGYTCSVGILFGSVAVMVNRNVYILLVFCILKPVKTTKLIRIDTIHIAVLISTNWADRTCN